MKKITITLSIIAGIVFLHSCSGGGEKSANTAETTPATNDLFKTDTSKKESDAKGIGKFTNVEVGAKLDVAMADAGLEVYNVKCSACHRLTDEKLVGPGWKDVTSRRTAEWIMNFSTNTDEMITNDPAAQAMLEECMVRMPNQSLSDKDARDVYEFMRKNDGIK